MSTKQLDMWNSNKPTIKKHASIRLWCLYLFNFSTKEYKFQGTSTFCLPTFFDCWNHDEELQIHLSVKLMRLYTKNGHCSWQDGETVPCMVGVLCEFYLSLSTNNQDRVNDWLRLCYRG